MASWLAAQYEDDLELAAVQAIADAMKISQRDRYEQVEAPKRPLNSYLNVVELKKAAGVSGAALQRPSEARNVPEAALPSEDLKRRARKHLEVKPGNPIATLHEFCQKSGLANPIDRYEPVVNGFCCHLRVTGFEVSESDSSKKRAKRKAAETMIQALLKEDV